MAGVFIIDHLAGCTPLKPCASCVAAAFLRRELSPDKFNELVDVIRDAMTDRLPLSTPLESLELSYRTSSCLRNDNMLTIGDVVGKTDRDLLKLPNFGRRSLNEIKEVLLRAGHKLGQPTRL
jgi:DNA-directed RNA polymerase subunit alpha